MKSYYFRGPVRFYEPLEESQRTKSSALYPLDEDLTSRLSAIKLTSIGGVKNDLGKNSLDISVDSSNSTDSSDVARELSWDVSRYGFDLTWRDLI